PGGFRHKIAQVWTNGISKSHMRGNAFAEECMKSALAGAIKKLRRQDHVTRRVFLLQTAYGRHRNDPANIQRTECIDVGPMIYFMRQNAVTATVPRQKVNLTAA